MTNTTEQRLCSVFKNFAEYLSDKTLHEIATEIASTKFKAEVEEVRELIDRGQHEAAAEKKQQLLAFTPSATFKGRRVVTHINQGNGVIHLDFDKVEPDEMERAFAVISSLPETLLCFRSPSGRGLKVFVVTAGAMDHLNTYSQVATYYESKTGLRADRQCKDITRLCFVSHDPHLYFNSKCRVFDVGGHDTGTRVEDASVDNNAVYSQVFHQCVSFTEQKRAYVNGSRNDFIYVLASNCNRAGIPQGAAVSLAVDRYDLPQTEVTAAFNSAYLHHSAEFAQFANLAKLQSDACAEGERNAIPKAEQDFLKNTPSVPEALYLKMPKIIRKGALVFTDPRERDVFLTGALSILSGCMPGVSGVYDGRKVCTNLFSFVVAPPASGKGALTFAKLLAAEYHASVLKKSRDAEAQYNLDLSAHKQRIAAKRKGDDTTEDQPTQPPFKVVFIPANTSYAKILWHLQQNEGKGIICETEADTLANALKQDWGSYSDMLRKAFHHETVSGSKKTNNEFIEVNTPGLSGALTGTPNQVVGIIASSEDGLMSRIMFYAFKAAQKWKDVSPAANPINLTEHFKTLSLKVWDLVQFLEKEETDVQLSPTQWQQLNDQCSAWLDEVTVFTSEDAGSIVKRLGLIIYRIAMVFTALRKFENAEQASTLTCTDNDFDIALQLAAVYLQHALIIYNNLPKQGANTKFKAGDGKQKFVEALPMEFTRKQAVELGRQFKLSESTVSHLLPKLVPTHFTQPKAGHYVKVNS